MKKQRKYQLFLLTLIGILTIISLMGCSSNGKDKDISSEAETVTEENGATTTEITESVESTEPESLSPQEEMWQRSLISIGNNYRMKKVLERARAGESLTVGFIGGSITQGMNAGETGCYAYLTYQYFAETYAASPDQINYVNAGLAGTPSVLGNIRSQRDLLQYEPDIIVIEFAVNDAQDIIHQNSYESLVRRCLAMENEPAVILLFTVTEIGYTCQQQMMVTGYSNGVPMISVPNAITPEIEAGNMVWQDYSDDDVHPDSNGHALIRDLFAYYFSQVDACETVDEPFQVKDVTPHKPWFQSAGLYDSTTVEPDQLGSFREKTTVASFPNGWKHDSDAGNDSLIFTFESNYLFLVYKQVNSSSYGSIDVIVDGERKQSINGNQSSGWNNPMPVFIFRDNADESKVHTLEIKMSEGSEDLLFELLGISY